MAVAVVGPAGDRGIVGEVLIIRLLEGEIRDGLQLCGMAFTRRIGSAFGEANRVADVRAAQCGADGLVRSVFHLRRRRGEGRKFRNWGPGMGEE